MISVLNAFIHLFIFSYCCLIAIYCGIMKYFFKYLFICDIFCGGKQIFFVQCQPKDYVLLPPYYFVSLVQCKEMTTFKIKANSIAAA